MAAAAAERGAEPLEGDRIIQADCQRSGSPSISALRANGTFTFSPAALIETPQVRCFWHKFPSLRGSPHALTLVFHQPVYNQSDSRIRALLNSHIFLFFYLFFFFRIMEREGEGKENYHSLTWKSRLGSRHANERCPLIFTRVISAVSLFFTVSMNGWTRF